MRRSSTRTPRASRPPTPPPDAVVPAAPPGAPAGRVCLVTMAVADLAPAPYNPRRISDEALAGLGASVDRFGLVEPVVWNRRTGHVVGGHQRLKVLQARGVQETDVVVVDLPEGEEKALNVALNSARIAGEWTPDALGVVDRVESLDAAAERPTAPLRAKAAKAGLADARRRG